MKTKMALRSPTPITLKLTNVGEFEMKTTRRSTIFCWPGKIMDWVQINDGAEHPHPHLPEDPDLELELNGGCYVCRDDDEIKVSMQRLSDSRSILSPI